MQRLNRSAQAPRGSAFVLFLSLALVPFSLRAAGVNVSFSPSLSAATDAWQQIADVFVQGYHPAGAVDSATLTNHDREPLRAFDSSACPGREFACAREVCESSAPAEEVSGVVSSPARLNLRSCPKSASRASALPAAFERGVTVAANTERLQTYVRALG